MIYIIMCGSNNGDVFGEYPRQLSKINGEVIVERTIRLLQESGVDKNDVFISSQNPIFDNYGVKRIYDKSNSFVHYNEVLGLKEYGFWVDAFCNLSIPVTYIFGDVYFSPEAIKTIVNYDTKDITFFGTNAPYDKRYIKPYQEPLAFKVINQKKFRDSINWVKNHFNEFNRHPISWELWEVINNQPINKLYFGGDFVAIRDYTCDVDAPKDIEKLENALKL